MNANLLNITRPVSPGGAHRTGGGEEQGGDYSAGTGCGSGIGDAAGRSRWKQRFTNTKKSGTKKIARKVAVSVPPTTARPIAFWLPAPGPLAIASGRTPKTNAKLVMRIGRSLSFAPATADSTQLAPAFIRSSANST